MRWTRAREDIVDEMIVRAANMIRCGAEERDVCAMLARETDDESLTLLILTAARLLAQS